MPNCDICGRLVGSFVSTTLSENVHGNLRRIVVCPDCKALMKDLKAGQLQAYETIHSIIDDSHKEDVIAFVSSWETVPEKYVAQHLEADQKKKEEEQRKKEEEKKNAEIARQKMLERERAIPSILISSGFSFEGYRIIKYSGYISGDDAVQIPRSGIFGGDNGQKLTNALVSIRRQALKELKEAAYDIGCNAVIGVDFDYITLEPQTATLTGGTLYEPYVICVTANGNAVVIEKE